MKHGTQSYKGMHNGTVSGKGFELSRRNRKSHAERRSNIVARSLALIGLKPARGK